MFSSSITDPHEEKKQYLWRSLYFMSNNKRNRIPRSSQIKRPMYMHTWQGQDVDGVLFNGMISLSRLSLLARGIPGDPSRTSSGPQASAGWKPYIKESGKRVQCFNNYNKDYWGTIMQEQDKRVSQHSWGCHPTSLIISYSFTAHIHAWHEQNSTHISVNHHHHHHHKIISSNNASKYAAQPGDKILK